MSACIAGTNWQMMGEARIREDLQIVELAHDVASRGIYRAR